MNLLIQILIKKILKIFGEPQFKRNSVLIEKTPNKSILIIEKIKRKKRY